MYDTCKLLHSAFQKYSLWLFQILPQNSYKHQTILSDFYEKDKQKFKKCDKWK